MSAVSAWVLVAVVWSGSFAPAVENYPQKNEMSCHKAADSFAAAMDAMNAGALPAFFDRYSAVCIQVSWGDVEDL